MCDVHCGVVCDAAHNWTRSADSEFENIEKISFYFGVEKYILYDS